MKAMNVPELFDSGYWYVVKPVSGSYENGGLYPDMPDNVSGWCAWYFKINSTDYCLVRTPEVVSYVPNQEDFSVNDAFQYLGMTKKPRGRVKGK